MDYSKSCCYSSTLQSSSLFCSPPSLIGLDLPQSTTEPDYMTADCNIWAPISNLYCSRTLKRTGNIMMDSSHPRHHLFDLFPSGRCVKAFRPGLTDWSTFVPTQYCNCRVAITIILNPCFHSAHITIVHKQIPLMYIVSLYTALPLFTFIFTSLSFFLFLQEFLDVSTYLANKVDFDH